MAVTLTCHTAGWPATDARRKRRRKPSPTWMWPWVLAMRCDGVAQHLRPAVRRVSSAPLLHSPHGTPSTLSMATQPQRRLPHPAWPGQPYRLGLASAGLLGGANLNNLNCHTAGPGNLVSNKRSIAPVGCCHSALWLVWSTYCLFVPAASSSWRGVRSALVLLACHGTGPW